MASAVGWRVARVWSGVEWSGEAQGRAKKWRAKEGVKRGGEGRVEREMEGRGRGKWKGEGRRERSRVK